MRSVSAYFLDWEMWTGPAPMRPCNALVHPRGWRAFTEYGNGIHGDTGIHMLDMARWMLDLGWPKRIGSTGGIFVDKTSKANIPDTQRPPSIPAISPSCGSTARGAIRSIPDTVGRNVLRRQGTLKAGVYGYDFTPLGQGKPIHREVAYELEQYPEDKTEKDLEQHVAPAIRRHLKDFLGAIASRGRPVADIEEGHISTASCILANLAMKLGGP